MRSQTMLATTLCLLMPMAAAGADRDTNIADKAPVIHLRQKAVLLRGGKPLVEKNYRYMLKTCEEAAAKGGIEVTPLPEDVARKLGRSFYDVWYDGRRMAVHSVYWDFKLAPAPKLCQFAPDEWRQASIIRPGASIYMDLRAGTEERGPSDGVERYPLAKQTEADRKMEAQVKAMLAQQGIGDLAGAVTKPAQVAGQPCLMSITDDGSSCTWSGGTQWGFATEPGPTPYPGSDGEATMPEDSILLSQDGGPDGVRLSTRMMTVGGVADGHAFDVPQGLTVKGGG